MEENAVDTLEFRMCRDALQWLHIAIFWFSFSVLVKFIIDNTTRFFKMKVKYSVATLSKWNGSRQMFYSNDIAVINNELQWGFKSRKSIPWKSHPVRTALFTQLWQRAFLIDTKTFAPKEV